MPRLSEIEWPDDRGLGRSTAVLRADRRERLRIALVMIGSGVLDGGKREAGGRRSEDRGKGTVSRGGAKNAELGGSSGERNAQR